MSKNKVPTDEEILACSKVSVLIAARYLGMTYPMLSYKLQQGEMPFGCASMSKSQKWVYNIDPQRLYDYKHNINENQVIQRILKQQAEIISMLTEIVKNKTN